MAEFNFYQDEKVTVWHRVRFTVEAESEADAIAKVKKYGSNIIGEFDDNIKHYESEWLYDTWEQVTPEDNEGFATIELYNDSNDLVEANGKY